MVGKIVKPLMPGFDLAYQNKFYAKQLVVIFPQLKVYHLQINTVLKK